MPNKQLQEIRGWQFRYNADMGEWECRAAEYRNSTHESWCPCGIEVTDLLIHIETLEQELLETSDKEIELLGRCAPMEPVVEAAVRWIDCSDEIFEGINRATRLKIAVQKYKKESALTPLGTAQEPKR